MAASKELLNRLESEYKEWVSKQNHDNIDEAELKETILEELNLFSGMTVEEYTLYIKWKYLREIYPKKDSDNYFFSSSTIDQYPDIIKVKSNIWNPSNGDFHDIKPELIFCDKAELTKEWTILRHFISTMNYRGLIGRRLNFIVKDSVSKKYLGVFCLSSDFLDLTPRDEYIGWDRATKTHGMINHTGIGSSIIPTQPLGFNLLGGKLLALMIISDEVVDVWNKKYKDDIAGITTTSLYGSFSQYNSLKHWKKMGKTTGSIKFTHTSTTFNLMKQWLKSNNPRFYFEYFVFQKASGPYKRDGTQRSTMEVYKKLGIKAGSTESNHQRGIYFCPLYDNTREFLRKEQPSLGKKLFDNSVKSLSEMWLNKYAVKRYKSLSDDNRLNNDILFYDDMLECDWSVIKEKYLKDVGR